MLTAINQVPLEVTDVSIFLGLTKWLVDQFNNHNNLPLIGTIIMIAVYIIANIFKNFVNRKYLPILSAGIGVLASCFINLLALENDLTTKDWTNAILTGLLSGTAASGFWSLLGKFFHKKFDSIISKIKSRKKA